MKHDIIDHTSLYDIAYAAARTCRAECIAQGGDPDTTDHHSSQDGDWDHLRSEVEAAGHDWEEVSEDRYMWCGWWSGWQPK